MSTAYLHIFHTDSVWPEFVQVSYNLSQPLFTYTTALLYAKNSFNVIIHHPGSYTLSSASSTPRVLRGKCMI